MNFSDFIKPIVVTVGTAVAMRLAHRWVPRNRSLEQSTDDGKRLPYGTASAIMWVLVLAIAIGGFYFLRESNHLWANWNHDSVLTIYPSSAIWCFLPGFACLLLPWLIVIWFLRRSGYAGQAAQIVLEGNKKMGWDGERLMRGLSWILIIPIAILTGLAIPMHLAVDSDGVEVTHFAHVIPESFRFVDARAAYLVDGYLLRDGSFEPHWDLLIDFSDGRRLSGNAVGDGGTTPSEALVKLLLDRTGLKAIHVRTKAEIPAGR